MRDRLRQRLAALFRRLQQNNHSGVEANGGRPTRISVIVPIHNTETYVERCLRSLMAQSMTEIEIVCVDDASPDRSASIVRRLARTDSRIRLIRHERNRGLGGARNTGIAAARSIYVTGVDSDDFVLPMMMERLWQASSNGSMDVVACGMAVLDAEGKLRFNVSQPEQTLSNARDQIDCLQLLNPSFCNKLWKRKLFNNHSIQFPESQYFEDLATTPRLLHFAKEIRIIGDPLYCYVQREGSITKSTSPKHILDHFRTFDILAEFLAAEGLLDSHRQAFVELIGKSLHYHSRTGAAEANNEAAADLQWLRYMLLLKLAYLAHNEKAQTLKADELRDLLLNATSSQDLPDQ